MLVIFCDCNDVDTRNLKAIWRGLDAKVIELSSNTNVSQEEIDKALEEEKDTIIICGHGCQFGCYYPNKINPYNMNLDNIQSFNKKFEIIVHLAGKGTV